ncbi:basic salivary proline-rich protein 1-like [Poecile atricapillus]|uniref:basic salivary proline-rich protein 1-like n=1 Tax=Poecile atricapillus TaxID=48891 RepID=UPI0027387802|nr:basic salivary proline-rich protein 1-like [Poecile atricapillus]
MPLALPSLLSAARREEADEQGQNCPICRTSPSSCPDSGSQTGNTDSRDKRLQTREHGPRRGPFPQGVLGAALSPLSTALRAPAAPVSEWEAALRGSSTKRPLSPRRSGGAGSGGREREPRQPPVTGRRQRAGPERPAAGHPPKLRDAKRAKLRRGLLPSLTNNPPGPQPRCPSHPRAPPLPHLPGVSAAPPDEPRRAASQSPPAHSQRPAGYRLPHPPPFHEESFPSQLPARPETRCPPREGGAGTRMGSAARTPSTPRGTDPKGAVPGVAKPAAVTPPLTSQAARRDGRRAAATWGRRGLSPPPISASGLEGPTPPPAAPVGRAPARGAPMAAAGQLRRGSRLPPPRPRHPALDPINGSGLCPGRWGRRRVLGGQLRLSSSSPPPPPHRGGPGAAG